MSGIFPPGGMEQGSGMTFEANAAGDDNSFREEWPFAKFD